jgi:mRNA interferase HigB
VQILGRAKLDDFGRRHAAARKRLAAWEKAVQAAEWKNLVELKGTFGSADFVDDEFVFGIQGNIGGNNFRLRAMVDFKAQTVLVTDVQTHSEYSRQR